MLLYVLAFFVEIFLQNFYEDEANVLTQKH